MSDSDKSKVPDYGLTLALDLSRSLHAEISHSNDVLDQRTTSLAMLSTAVAGAASTATLWPAGGIHTAQSALVAVVCVIALVVLSKASKSIRPRRREQVIGVDLQQTFALFVNQSPDDSANQAIGQYAMVSQQESNINADKALGVTEIIRLVALQAFVLSVAVAWPVVVKICHDAMPSLP